MVLRLPRGYGHCMWIMMSVSIEHKGNSHRVDIYQGVLYTVELLLIRFTGNSNFHTFHLIFVIKYCIIYTVRTRNPHERMVFT